MGSDFLLDAIEGYNDSEACWNVSQLFEFLVGTVLGSHGNYGIPNCGGGGAAARSSLDQGSPESKSLSCAVLRETVLRMDACPVTGDNGNGRWLAVTKARRTMLLITASSLQCASLKDC